MGGTGLGGRELPECKEGAQGGERWRWRGGGAGLGGRELPECREGGFDAHWSCMEKRFSAHTLFHKVLGLKQSQF